MQVAHETSHLAAQHDVFELLVADLRRWIHGCCSSSDLIVIATRLFVLRPAKMTSARETIIIWHNTDAVRKAQDGMPSCCAAEWARCDGHTGNWAG